MIQIVNIRSITRGTQVIITTLRTPKSNASYASFGATVTDDVRMLDTCVNLKRLAPIAYGIPRLLLTNLCVVDDDQIELILISNAIIGSIARIPIYDNGFLG